MTRARRIVGRAALTALAAGGAFLGYNFRQALNCLNSMIDLKVLEDLETSTAAEYSEPVDAKEPPFAPDNIITSERIPGLYRRLQANFTFALAYRLMHLARSEDVAVRRKAIRHLGRIHDLEDWHFTSLAGMCDADTAVGLAREPGVDHRFFMSPKCDMKCSHQDTLMLWMKSVLVNMHTTSSHRCLSYVIEKVFVEAEHFVEESNVNIAVNALSPSEQLLPYCLSSMLHHTSLGDFAKSFIHNDGSALLLEISRKYPNDIGIKTVVGKIIANVSHYPESLPVLFSSGWIGVLAAWSKDECLSVSAPAAKALANLDRDNPMSSRYLENVFLLYPFHRNADRAAVDVVFVHGLLGGVFYTWRQNDKYPLPAGMQMLDETPKTEPEEPKINPKFFESADVDVIDIVEEPEVFDDSQIFNTFAIIPEDFPSNSNETGKGPFVCKTETFKKAIQESKSATCCWPKDWLAADCPNLRILGINYETSLSLWAPACPHEPNDVSLDLRSSLITEKLLAAGLGQRPIVWVAHSMGGLLVKNILVKAFISEDEDVKKISENTKGIVFFSTPHRGSTLANLRQGLSLVLWPSIEVRELKDGSQMLVKLQEDFDKMLDRISIKILSFVETIDTAMPSIKLSFRIVTVDSARMDQGELFEIPQDHLNICKPSSRCSFLYIKLVSMIEEILKEK